MCKNSEILFIYLFPEIILMMVCLLMEDVSKAKQGDSAFYEMMLLVTFILCSLY